jgi:outer membrane protein assembly factor BamB
MRRTNRILALTVMATAAGVNALAASEDWPKWMGPRGDAISKETLPDKLPEELKRAWTVKVGVGYSSPIAVKGIVYYFGAKDPMEPTEAVAGKKKPEARIETLYAIDAAKGTETWKQSYLASGLNENNFKGTRATPVFEDGKIYTLGGGGTVTCWDAADNGKILWQVNVLEQTQAKNLNWGTSSSPLIVGDRIFVHGGIDGPVAIGIDKKTGKIDWLAEEKGKGGYSQLSAIDVEGNKQLIAFGNNGIYAVSLDTKKTVWTHPWKTQYDISATTPLYRDGHLLVSSGSGRGSLMLKLTATSATKVWDEKEMQARFQPMILDGEYLYGNSEGRLKCLHWPDGKLVWKETFALGPGGSMVKAGDKLLMISEKGRLFLVKTDGPTRELLGETKLFDADQVWATPLLYEGRMIAKGGDELVCFELK